MNYFPGSEIGLLFDKQEKKWFIHVLCEIDSFIHPDDDFENNERDLEDVLDTTLSASCHTFQKLYIKFVI